MRKDKFSIYHVFQGNQFQLTRVMHMYINIMIIFTSKQKKIQKFHFFVEKNYLLNREIGKKNTCFFVVFGLFYAILSMCAIFFAIHVIFGTNRKQEATGRLGPHIYYSPESRSKSDTYIREKLFQSSVYCCQDMRHIN